jgi:Flp pilus assembly protein TadG
MLRFLSERRGGVALEFAIITPVLVFTLCGLWDFARLLAEDGRVSNAALAGAHYGMQSAAHAADTAAMVRAARDDAADAGSDLSVSAERYCICPSGGSVSCTDDCGLEGKPIMHVHVGVRREFRTLMTYPFITNPVPLFREAHIRVE